MPIEIKELHIRVSVNALQASHPAGVPGSSPGAVREEHETLIADCVERVLEILRDSRER